MEIFKKIIYPILIMIYQFFAIFFGLVIGDMVVTGYKEPSDIIICAIIILVGYAVIAAFYFPLWFLFRKINGINPAIKRSKLIIHHLIGFIFVFYTILVTFVPKFPNVLSGAFDYEVFAGKNIFIFGIIPVVGSIVTSFFVPYCHVCGFIGTDHHGIVYEEVSEIVYMPVTKFRDEKVGERIKTTRYYDSETGTFDHEEVDKENIYETRPYEVMKYVVFYKRAYECLYCGKRYYFEEVGEEYDTRPSIKVGETWCAYDDSSEFKNKNYKYEN